MERIFQSPEGLWIRGFHLSSLFFAPRTATGLGQIDAMKRQVFTNPVQLAVKPSNLKVGSRVALAARRTTWRLWQAENWKILEAQLDEVICTFSVEMHLTPGTPVILRDIH